MSSEQQHFAEVVLAAFAAAGRHTDAEVAQARGPSSTTMTLLRKLAEGDATVTKLRSDTLRRIELAANWRTGDAKEFWLNGTEPTRDPMGRPLSEGHPPAPAVRREGMDAYVRSLEARILETEERLDLIEAQLETAGSGSGMLDEKSLNRDDVPGGAAAQPQMHRTTATPMGGRTKRT